MSTSLDLCYFCFTGWFMLVSIHYFHKLRILAFAFVETLVRNPRVDNSYRSSYFISIFIQYGSIVLFFLVSIRVFCNLLFPKSNDFVGFYSISLSFPLYCTWQCSFRIHKCELCMDTFNEITFRLVTLELYEHLHSLISSERLLFLLLSCCYYWVSP